MVYCIIVSIVARQLANLAHALGYRWSGYYYYLCLEKSQVSIIDFTTRLDNITDLFSSNSVTFFLVKGFSKVTDYIAILDFVISLDIVVNIENGLLVCTSS